MRYLAIALTSLALALPHAAPAQGTRATRPFARGDRVRVSTTGDTAATTGKVLMLDAEHVVIAPDDSGAPARPIALSEISHLEVERDSRARTIGATVGGLLGLAAGASYYYLDLCRQDQQGCAREQRRAIRANEYGQTYWTTGDVLALGGFLAGGMIGYFLAPAPHWEIIASPAVQRDEHGEAHTALRFGLTRRLLGR